MAIRSKKTKAQFNQQTVNDYLKATGAVKFDKYDAAEWAIANGRWAQSHHSEIAQCAHELSEAMKEEYMTDAKGRRVRRKHAARYTKDTPEGRVQHVLWADIFDAPPDHMRLSLQQRRMSILADCKQLQADVDSYNDFNKHGAYIQMTFDFGEDLEDAKHSSDYPGNPPEDDDIDDDADGEPDGTGQPS